MSFADDISAALTDAMRKRDSVRLSTLRMLKAALMNREVEKGRALDDSEAKQVVGSLVKQRRDSIEQFVKGGRPELAEKEGAEIAILESYLPAAATPEAIAAAIAEAVAETGAKSAKEMGLVMKATMVKLAGQTTDGKVVSDLVRKALASPN